MRGKADSDALPCQPCKGLFNLGRMAMPWQTIGFKALIDLTVESIDLGGTTGTTRTGLAVHDKGFMIDQTIFKQRCQGQSNTGRVTSRIGNQTSLGNPLTKQLRQAVNSFIKQFSGSMLLVPLFVNFDISDAEVGREIDNPATGSQQSWDHPHRCLMRDRGKNQISTASKSNRVYIFEAQINNPM